MSYKYIVIAALFSGLFMTGCNRITRTKEDINPDTVPKTIVTIAPEITLMPEADYKAEGMEGRSETLSADNMSNYSGVINQGEPNMFLIEHISQDIKDRINGKSYGKDCTVPYEDLRYVRVLYWGFDNQPHEGELIVNKAIAEDIVDIFKELYEHKYPIEKMILVDEYDADDNASMADNNTSAFNFRLIDNGSGKLSKHSYGLAIDINPLYNPYVRTVKGKTVVSPENGTEYADRTADCPYYIKKDDICYKAFTSRGFVWGGEWKNSKDYQHFEKDID